jgi:hypothetical protein
MYAITAQAKCPHMPHTARVLTACERLPGHADLTAVLGLDGQAPAG